MVTTPPICINFAGTCHGPICRHMTCSTGEPLRRIRATTFGCYGRRGWSLAVPAPGKETYGAGQRRARPCRWRRASRTLRKRIAARLSGFLKDWSLPRQLAGAERRWRRRPIQYDVANAAAAAGAGGPGRHQHLPVLRRGLRPTGLCQERQADPHRGRSAQSGEPGHAVPEGRRHAGHAAVAGSGSTRAVSRAPRRPSGRRSPLDWAMERIAQHIKRTRDETFVERLPDGTHVNHTLGIGSLGGATLDNEENYLIKKLFGGGLGHGEHREPGQDLTLVIGAQSGDDIRTRRGDHGPVGPGERRLHRRDGLQHGGEPSGRASASSPRRSGAAPR